VKDKHCLGKLDGVHGAVGAANIAFHHFKQPCANDKAKPKSRRTSAGKSIKSLWLLPIHSSGFSFVGMAEIYMN